MAHLHSIIALPWTTLFALKIRNNMATLVVLLVEGTWVASFLKGYHFWHSHIKPSLNDAAFCVLTKSCMGVEKVCRHRGGGGGGGARLSLPGKTAL